jgi:hypothetical protein
MHTAFFRDGDMLTAPEPVANTTGVLAVLGRLLEKLVHANAGWLPSPDGKISPEWLKYPPF